MIFSYNSETKKVIFTCNCGREYGIGLDVFTHNDKARCLCGTLVKLGYHIIQIREEDEDETKFNEMKNWLSDNNITYFLRHQIPVGGEPSTEDILASIRRILSEGYEYEFHFLNSSEATLFKLVWG